MDYSVVITAGGIGKRMGGTIPKQFIAVAGQPVLFHTIALFHRFDPEAQLVISLPEDWMDYWKELIDTYNFSIPVTIVNGGKERFHSIKNALAVCEGNQIWVHDGVRPLVSIETLERCKMAMINERAVIPVVAVKESLRKVDGADSTAVPRAEYRVVQTPQCFERNVLLQAYDQTFHAGITDDATLVEALGISICCVEGNDTNVKITTPADLALAELLLK